MSKIQVILLIALLMKFNLGGPVVRPVYEEPVALESESYNTSSAHASAGDYYESGTLDESPNYEREAKSYSNANYNTKPASGSYGSAYQSPPSTHSYQPTSYSQNAVPSYYSSASQPVSYYPVYTQSYYYPSSVAALYYPTSSNAYYNPSSYEEKVKEFYGSTKQEHFHQAAGYSSNKYASTPSGQYDTKPAYYPSTSRPSHYSSESSTNMYYATPAAGDGYDKKPGVYSVSQHQLETYGPTYQPSKVYYSTETPTYYAPMKTSQHYEQSYGHTGSHQSKYPAYPSSSPYSNY